MVANFSSVKISGQLIYVSFDEVVKISTRENNWLCSMLHASLQINMLLYTYMQFLINCFAFCIVSKINTVSSHLLEE